MKSIATLAAAGLLAIIGSSCQSTTAGTGGEYPQYAQDGTYNPYPTQSTPQYQTYQPSQQYQQYTPPPQSYTPPPQEPSYTPPPSSYSSSNSGSGGSYTVQRGDTLYRIALNHGVTVSRLKSANGLTSDLIRPGQVLTIP